MCTVISYGSTFGRAILNCIQILKIQNGHWINEFGFFDYNGNDAPMQRGCTWCTTTKT